MGGEENKPPFSFKPPSPPLYHSSLITDRLINQSRLFKFVWTDPGWFVHQLEARICFWSSAAWPPTSCTWAFPFCILVPYGEMIPSSGLNQRSPPSLLRTIKPPPHTPSNVFELNMPPRGGGLIEDLRNTKGDSNFWVGLLGAWFNIFKTQARKRASFWISMFDPDANIQHLISKHNTISASFNCL